MTHDPRWQAIINKINEIASDGVHVLSTRGRSMETPKSGGVSPALHCIAKFGFRDPERDAIGDDVFLFTAREVTGGFATGIDLRIEGPWTDSHDEYWNSMVGHPAAIITPDWVHRTVSKDDPRAVAAGGGGHGGAEFRFKLDKETAKRFEVQGLKVDSERADGTRILTTHNCWYQGVIPPKHRHMFKVNAEMVKGFNPRRNV